MFAPPHQDQFALIIGIVATNLNYKCKLASICCKPVKRWITDIMLVKAQLDSYSINLTNHKKMQNIILFHKSDSRDSKCGQTNIIKMGNVKKTTLFVKSIEF